MVLLVTGSIAKTEERSEAARHAQEPKLPELLLIEAAARKEGTLVKAEAQALEIKWERWPLLRMRIEFAVRKKETGVEAKALIKIEVEVREIK